MTGSSFDPNAWAQITIERWEEKIMQQGIGSSNTLINSFTHQVNTDSNGNPTLIIFAFEYYGRMVELGVGNGVPYAEVEQSNRTAKPWYSQTLAREVKALAALLAQHFGTKATVVIKNAIEQ